MSENTAMQIIELLSEKFGIIIDFTKENIVPYAIDLSNRYINYYIAISIFKIICFLMCIGILIMIFKVNNKIKNKTEKDTDKYQFCIVIQILLILVITAISIFAMICIPSFIIDIIKAIYIPDIVILDILRGN